LTRSTGYSGYFYPGGIIKGIQRGKQSVFRWNVLANKGIDREYLISKSLISPATCCLVNPDGEKTVEDAFKVLTKLSQSLRDKYLTS